MKKSKKLFSVILLVIMLSNLCFSASASNTEIKADQILTDEILVSKEKGSEFSIPGIEYSSEMPIVTDKVQMDYILKVNEISLHQGKIIFCAKIYNENQTLLEEISQEGDIFESNSTSGKESGRITTMFSHDESKSYRILNCSFEVNPIVDLLFPANSDLSGTPVITFAVMVDDKILYFEGALPNDIIHERMDNIALNKKEIEEMTKLRSSIIAFSSDVLKEVETADEIIEEVQASESWRLFVDPITEEDIVMLDDEKSIADNLGILTRASVSGVPTGMPADVFQKVGSWGSVNNPNNPSIGYVAITARRNGTTNVNETQLIQWEYIYNKCSDFAKGADVSSGGATAIKLKTTGTYVYYASQNKIQLENSNSYLKITSAAIAMGLRSDEQILSYAKTSIVSKGSSVKINWKGLLGLIPSGYVQTALKLFSLIEYKAVDNTTAEDDYQDTAAKQKSSYGKLIRGRKLACNGNELTKNNDSLRIGFQVRQPRDLPRTSKTQYISSKYFFFIYGRDAWGAYTDKIKTVNETREASYYVN